MNGENVFVNLAILFVVTGFFLAFLRAQRYWRSRFPDQLPADLQYTDVSHHSFSLRRGK